MHTSIEDVISSLVLRSSFWAMTISKFNKRETSEKTFLMGVTFNGNDVEFIYNFDNLKMLHLDILDKLFAHEVGHILNNHYVRALEKNIFENNLNHRWNIAADMAVNCNIPNFPKSFYCGWDFHTIFPEQEGFEDGLLTEDYFNKLKEDEEESNDDSENDDSEEKDSDESSEDKPESNADSEEGEQSNNESDDGKDSDESGEKKTETTGSDQNDHTHWEESSKNSKDPNIGYIAENIFREVIESTSREYTQSFGSLPNDLKVRIDDFIAPPKLPYYEIIKKLVTGSRMGKQKISYSKLNRKRMYVFTEDDELVSHIPPFPGKKNDVTFKIGVVLDTSASVPITDDGIYEALNGLESILKNDSNSEIILLQVDTDIREEKKLKSIKDIHRIQIKGRGGTRMMPGLNRLKELKVDVCLVFTDGYIEDLSSFIYSLPKKIIWILPEKGSSERMIENIGHIVKFPVSDL